MLVPSSSVKVCVVEVGLVSSHEPTPWFVLPKVGPRHVVAHAVIAVMNHVMPARLGGNGDAAVRVPVVAAIVRTENTELEVRRLGSGDVLVVVARAVAVVVVRRGVGQVLRSCSTPSHHRSRCRSSRRER